MYLPKYREKLLRPISRVIADDMTTSINKKDQGIPKRVVDQGMTGTLETEKDNDPHGFDTFACLSEFFARCIAVHLGGVNKKSYAILSEK